MEWSETLEIIILNKAHTSGPEFFTLPPHGAQYPLFPGPSQRLDCSRRLPLVVRPSLSYLSSQSDSVHSSFLNEYILGTYYVPSPFLGDGHTRGIHSSCPYWAYSLCTDMSTQPHLHRLIYHNRCSHVCVHTVLKYTFTDIHSHIPAVSLCKHLLSLIHVWHLNWYC